MWQLCNYQNEIPGVTLAWTGLVESGPFVTNYSTKKQKRFATGKGWI